MALGPLECQSTKQSSHFFLHKKSLTRSNPTLVIIIYIFQTFSKKIPCSNNSTKAMGYMAYPLVVEGSFRAPPIQSQQPFLQFCTECQHSYTITTHTTLPVHPLRLAHTNGQHAAMLGPRQQQQYSATHEHQALVSLHETPGDENPPPAKSRFCSRQLRVLQSCPQMLYRDRCILILYDCIPLYSIFFTHVFLLYTE